MSQPSLSEPSLNEQTSDLIQSDQRYVWHPFTQHAEWQETEPLIITAAQGAELIDAQGRRYLDGVASLWVGVHGHRHPRVDAAIKDQLDRVAHSTLLGLGNIPATRLAKKLIQMAPAPMSRVFYSDAGSTAVEIALKMAFQWQQQAGDPKRTRFARFEHAYHGDTLGAVSVGGIDLFHQVYGPLLFDTVALPTPLNPEPAVEAKLLQQALATLDAEGDTLAAIIVEPLVQGAAGMRMHSPGYLNAILAKAKAVGALVILDEVATGFGRTGTLFAAEQLSVTPDLMCLGKGLSNGYLPLAATLASERIFQGFVGTPRDTFFHGHTFTGNPLACAAGVACLELFEEERTLERVSRRATELERGLSEFSQHAHVSAVRQQGLMIGLDLCQANGAPYDSALRTGARFCFGLRSQGVVLRPLGDTVVLMPPLCISAAQTEQLLEALRWGLDALIQQP
ncbi:MAG: adenosylmethionine-8-amino-7-oxononanoate aminotransferase [Cognaticolwellia sp.]